MLSRTVWGGRFYINQDIKRYQEHFGSTAPVFLYLLYLLTVDRYFRTVFYHRVGPVAASLLSWYRPGDKYFSIPKGLQLGGGCLVYHPYATVLNAEKIGRNFTCIQCTTLGYGKGGRPYIGDNVSLGANVVIIGGVKIGNNVIVGAGSVVVKDVPDNSVVAGNPAKVIRYLESKE
ncbi:MAG: serine acetyltransferase [Aeriscardovia sp.]|nr:serine acetyltransferase [Aeriscardovia sp.]MBO6253223.1 serine acetyltransferase [Bacteroidaceae bacterium]